MESITYTRAAGSKDRIIITWQKRGSINLPIAVEVSIPEHAKPLVFTLSHDGNLTYQEILWRLGVILKEESVNIKNQK